jgi:hypothetical protein
MLLSFQANNQLDNWRSKDKLQARCCSLGDLVTPGPAAELTPAVDERRPAVLLLGVAGEYLSALARLRPSARLL